MFVHLKVEKKKKKREAAGLQDYTFWPTRSAPAL